jgi:galactonate dehydratase
MERRNFLKGLAGSGLLGMLGSRITTTRAQQVRDARFPDNLADSLGKRSGHLIADVRAHIIGPGDRKNLVLLEIETDQGVVGYSEATLEGKAKTMQAALTELPRFLLGKDPTMIEHLWQYIYRTAFWRGGPVMNTVLSAMDIALWDIKGKILNCPIYDLLGGPVRDKIKMYSHWGASMDASVSEMRDLGMEVYEAGYRAVKTSPRPPVSASPGPAEMKRQVGYFERMREALPDEVDIAIDFHGRFSPAAAIRFGQAIDHLNCLFYEEPCLPENVDAMAKIADQVSTPIATGERIFLKWGFVPYLEGHIVDIIQPDIIHAGGISETRRICAMAEAYYATTALHCPYGPFALAACLQVDATIPNFLIQESAIPWRQGGTPFRKEIVIESIEIIEDGYLTLPKKPGLGVELNLEILGKYPYRPDSQGIIFHEDNSLADW